jgi:diacylglycerol kinase
LHLKSGFLRVVSSVHYKIEGAGGVAKKETMTRLVTSLATIALVTGVVTDHSYLTWAGAFVWAVIAVKTAIG